MHLSHLRFTSIPIVIAVSFFIWIHWDLPVNAQTPNSTSFLTYQNPTEGYSIQYPSDWQVTGNGTSDAVIKFSPSDASKLSLIVTTTKPAPYLDIVTMTVKNTTTQQLLREKLLYAIPFRQMNVTIGGNSGIKNEYLDRNIYSFEIYIIGNGRLYTLTYNDESLNVPKTLPLINKMVDTFQFKP